MGNWRKLEIASFCPTKVAHKFRENLKKVYARLHTEIQLFMPPCNNILWTHYHLAFKIELESHLVMNGWHLFLDLARYLADAWPTTFIYVYICLKYWAYCLVDTYFTPELPQSLIAGMCYAIGHLPRQLCKVELIWPLASRQALPTLKTLSHSYQIQTSPFTKMKNVSEKK